MSIKGIDVKFVDKMGDDFRIFEAAKATLGGELESNFSREVTDPTRLINFLARERHITPFRHPKITFECEAPIFIARQLGKHQVGFDWNERSMRYRDSTLDFFEPEQWRGRPDNLHEGSLDEEVEGKVWIEDYPHTLKQAYTDYIEKSQILYQEFLDQGAAPEQCRMLLPQSMLTRWMWTGSLYGWFEVYRQRSSIHAQYEVRCFAEQLDTHMSKLYPIAWKALKDNMK